MKAVCWEGKKNVQVHEVPDPKILNPRDAVIRITTTAICGSDLHLYNGYIPTMEKGDILGHEFMGVVVETGSECQNLKRADAKNGTNACTSLPGSAAQSHSER